MKSVVYITDKQVNVELGIDAGLFQYFCCGVLHRIPLDDIAVIVVENQRCLYTHQFLASLSTHKVLLVLCDHRHLPVSLLLPPTGSSLCVQRQRIQLAASDKLKCRIWKQVVQAKLRGQAYNLPLHLPVRKRILAMVRTVRAGDPSNVEGRAAAHYWPAVTNDPTFRRDRTLPGINAYLNYGYTILRSLFCRAIVAAGLIPSVGIHHCGIGNHFCLADDLMEPFRPFVDRLVFDNLPANDDWSALRAKLVALPACYGQVNGEWLSILDCVERMVVSLVYNYDGKIGGLCIPDKFKENREDVGNGDV